jgi:hypothetical protein
MKTIFAICGLTLVIAAALFWRAAAKPARYGAFTGAPKAQVATLIADPRPYLKQTVEIEGVITQQCKSMGCFFFFHSGNDALRVDLQEVAMTAPMREGHKARVEGRMVPYNDGYQFWASGVELE